MQLMVERTALISVQASSSSQPIKRMASPEIKILEVMILMALISEAVKTHPPRIRKMETLILTLELKDSLRKRPSNHRQMLVGAVILWTFLEALT